jgi:AcrR family transcriptional regulator
MVPTERHREVLEAALHLIAERGYHGASLRELARRLGMSQPSLYHYFESKEAIVAQIIRHLGTRFFGVRPFPPPPRRLEDVPELIRWLIFKVYENPDYPVFVRFVFAVSAERPEYREAIYEVYRETATRAAEVLLRPLVDESTMTLREAVFVVRIMTHAIGLALIEDLVLLGEPEPPAELRTYADFVVEVVRLGVVQLLAQREAAGRG